MRYVIFFLLLSISTLAQTDKPLAEIPFEMFDDNQIYIQIKVNETDSLRFNIDTGASSFVVVDSIAKNLLKLRFDGEDINIGATSSQKVLSSSDNMVEIGRIKLDSITFYAIPYENVLFDGIIGCELFLKYVVSINYDSKTIKLYDPKKYNYTGAKHKFKVKMKDGIPLLQASYNIDNLEKTGWFMLDTGAGDRISFNSPAVKEYDLLNKLQIVGYSTNYDSNGNVTKTSIGLVREITIGTYSIYNVMAGLNTFQGGSGSDASYVGAFGNRVLNKFNIIYDLGNDTLYLEPKYFD